MHCVWRVSQSRHSLWHQCSPGRLRGYATDSAWPSALHHTTLLCTALLRLNSCVLFFFFFPVAHLSPAMFQRAGLRGLEAGSVPVARGRLLSPSHCWPTECTLVLTLALVVDAHTQMQKHKCVVQTHTHTRTLSYAHAHTRS